MDQYKSVSYELAEHLTKRYSTSFSMSSRLFDVTIRPHIYAIYGMVRLADEIVDTYKRSDALEQLEAFRQAVLEAVEKGYSVNPLLHAFALTARLYGIKRDLLDPFFDSMAMDVEPQDFTVDLYNKYIYGSAEVVGLMCLRVFVDGDNTSYEALSKGAQALGAAYQKVNFLRDMRADYEELGRVYFPNVSFEGFDDKDKARVVSDIDADFLLASQVIEQLPRNSRKAVRASSYYYQELLHKLKIATPDLIKSQRLRVGNLRKIILLLKAVIKP